MTEAVSPKPPQLEADGDVGEQILLTFYAKDQHTIKETAIELSEGAAVCTDALAAKVSCSNGKVLITDSNPPVAPNLAIAAYDVKVSSGEAFSLVVGTTASDDLSDCTFTIEWDTSLLSFVSAANVTSVETISANSRRIKFTPSAKVNRLSLSFTAAKIADFKATSWAKITTAAATGVNGLAAKVTSSLPVTANVFIVREINVYDPGDIDGDGKLTDADLEKLKNYIIYRSLYASWEKASGKSKEILAKQLAAKASYNLTGKAKTAADVNSDGNWDANDVSMLTQLIASAKEAGL